MISVRRYRVSLWSYQASTVEGIPFYLRKETVAATEEKALQNVMRQAGISMVHSAKVVALRANTCLWLKHICL